MTIWFVDTSVLCNLLEVPQKSQHIETAKNELASKMKQGQQLILPFAAVIETGNHIGQLKNGTQRRTCAEKFEQVLSLSARGQAPWVLHEFAWGKQYLELLVSGIAGYGGIIQLATQRVGAGDLSILVERHLYAQRTTHVDVRLWTYDQLLDAHS